MSEDQEKAKNEDQGENKEGAHQEKTPGYCSATCVCLDCLKQVIKKQEPLKTSDVFICKLPPKFEHPHWFNGYGSQVNKQHPLYRTTTSEYGWYPPGIHSVPNIYEPLNQHFTSHLSATGMYRIHSVPSQFFPAGQKFTNHLAAAGMYRNYSLNTGMDRSMQY